MAAITPTSIVRASAGSLTMLKASFAGTADDGDTWASGLGTNVVSYVIQDTDNPTTQASVGVAAEYSSGTFTFYPAEDNKSFDVVIWATI